MLLLVLSLFAFALVQAARFTNHFIGIRAGEPFVLSWEGDGTEVTITLLRGPDNNLVPIRNITADNPCNGTLADTYVWYPRPWLSSTMSGHAMSITQSGVTEVTGKFKIDTMIAHDPPTNSPIMLDPTRGTLVGGWEGLSAGVSSAGYTGSWHPAYMTSSESPAPWPNATDVPEFVSGTSTGPTPICTEVSATACEGGAAKMYATESSGNRALVQMQTRAVYVMVTETMSMLGGAKVEKKAESGGTRVLLGPRLAWAVVVGVLVQEAL